MKCVFVETLQDEQAIVDAFSKGKVSINTNAQFIIFFYCQKYLGLACTLP